MPELTLGSFNLHMGRGTPGHDAPVFDVIAAVKEIDTDVLVLQEAWVPDDDLGHVLEIADTLGYSVAASFAEARASCEDRVRLVAPEGSSGDGDWSIAVLSRLPVTCTEVWSLGPKLPRDPARRALLVAGVEVDGEVFTVASTHFPLLTDRPWRLREALHTALPAVGTPAAFAGDMNMWSLCVDRLTPAGWRRAVKGRTYPSHRPHSQTDHIVVTPTVEVVDSEVVPQQMSDHRPVRARLRF